VPFLAGILVGLGTLLFIGPVLFYLIQVSSKGGFYKGFLAALGIIVGDIIYVLTLLFGLDDTIFTPKVLFYFSFVGGAILISFGVNYLFQIKSKVLVKKKGEANSGIFVKAFLINFVNPFVLAVWIAFMSYSKAAYKGDEWIVLLGILFAIFATDLIKAFYASKLKSIFESDKMKLFYVISGALFIVFGVRLLIYSFNLW
jgi:threonine/homoserine/homoserine lactone efflux protein